MSMSNEESEEARELNATYRFLAGIHEYFDRASPKWNILDFLNECEAEQFDQKIGLYIRSLEKVANKENGERQQNAHILLEKYRKKVVWSSRLEADLTLAPQGADNLKGWLSSRLKAEPGARPDYHLARKWKNECGSTGPSIHLHNPTFTGNPLVENSGNVNSEAFNLSNESASKRKKDDDHEKPYGNEEDNINDFDQEAIYSDNSLYIENICVRSQIMEWRKKSNLLRYNIIDTIESSSSNSRNLFKDIWGKMIDEIEAMLSPTAETAMSGNVKDVQVEVVKLTPKLLWRMCDRRNPGSKIDAIIKLLEVDLELSVVEVSGSPKDADHNHYIGD
ncbi:13362_t:CDS:2, partial [Racocetra persica]